MNNDYRIYEQIVEDKALADGACLERDMGCNGEQHASVLIKIFYDDKGEVEFAEHLATRDEGVCDGAHASRDDLGGFLHPVA